jgi:sialic acid synthase SpsE
LQDCNLNVIETLKTAFDVPVGYSDHTADPTIAPVVAVSIGANILEKHFTLSRKLEGPDHPFSLEPLELKKMVEEVRKVEKTSNKALYVRELFGNEKTKTALGIHKKIISPSEKEIYPNDKRSIHAIENIRKGDKLTTENIMILRSERNLNPGIHPKYYELLLGKIVSRYISNGNGITWDDLLVNGEESGN